MLYRWGKALPQLGKDVYVAPNATVFGQVTLGDSSSVWFGTVVRGDVGVQTWVRKLGPILVMITCHDLDNPLKSVRYWGSTLLALSAQELVDILAIRWNIETFFEYDKDLLGSDHYQLMTTQAILRFWTLISCLLYFLEEQRTQQDLPRFTCGVPDANFSSSIASISCYGSKNNSR